MSDLQNRVYSCAEIFLFRCFVPDDEEATRENFDNLGSRTYRAIEDEDKKEIIRQALNILESLSFSQLTNIYNTIVDSK